MYRCRIKCGQLDLIHDIKKNRKQKIFAWKFADKYTIIIRQKLETFIQQLMGFIG